MTHFPLHIGIPSGAWRLQGNLSKHVWTKLILLAYATHPEMGMPLGIDPQGEFAKGINGGSPENFAIDIAATRLRELGPSP